MKIFKNKNSQVRSGWQIVSVYGSVFIATMMLSFFIIFFYTMIMVATGNVDKSNLTNFTKSLDAMTRNMGSPLGFTMNIIQCLCMIFFVVLFWKLFNKKPIREIGFINLGKGYKDLIKGLVFGAVSLTAVFIILLAAGQVTLVNPLNKPNFNYTLITGLIIFIFVGIDEEMFSRGFCITVLKQTNNKYVPVIGSAIIFSVMHSLNPGISVLSYINLFLFGLLTAYMAIKSKNLWLSIGFHITWNYFEGNVCGFLVSGQDATGIYKLKLPFKNIINGGNFGPEGGLAVTFIILIGLIYMWKFYKPAKINEPAI